MYRNEQIADVRYSIDRMAENLKHCKVSKVNKKGVIFRHYARKKDGTVIRPRFARCLVIPVDD